MSNRNKQVKPSKSDTALAYKWGRILWRCWQDNVPYDEEKYVAALRQKQSPLVKRLAVITV
jgi:hypothetical protein